MDLELVFILTGSHFVQALVIFCPGDSSNKQLDKCLWMATITSFLFQA